MAFAAGQVLSAAALNAALGTTFDRGNLTVSQTIGTASAWQRVTGYTLTASSSGLLLDPSTGKVTIPTGAAGRYQFIACAMFNTETSARRIAGIEKGAGSAGTGTYLARYEVTSAGYAGFTLATEDDFAAGDVVSFVVWSSVTSSLRGDLSPVSFSVKRTG